jgi:hypothetical protein
MHHCFIVHEGLHRRAANSRPLGLSLGACFVVTDSAGQKLAYLSRMITVNYFMQFLGAKSAGEIDQCRLVNQRLKSSNSSGGLFPRKLVGGTSGLSSHAARMEQPISVSY